MRFGERKMNCFICKGDIEEKMVTHSVDIDSYAIVVKDVPAKVCKQCGEVWYNDAVSSQLDKILEEVVASGITEVTIVKYSDQAV
jgi:YgiT-type zinc finger domain-containing protein